MPSNTFFGMQHLNQNLLCAIGIETTGPDPTRHELAEVCVLPMDRMLEIHKDLILFNMRMRIEMPEEIDWSKIRLSKAEVGELTQSSQARDSVAEYFLQWFKDMNMPFRKKIIPLCYNFAYVRAVLLNWLGDDIYHEIFHEDYRDPLIATHFINDHYDVRAESVPFAKQNFRWIAKQLNIEVVEQGGSACADAYTTCEMYRKLLKHSLRF